MIFRVSLIICFLLQQLVITNVAYSDPENPGEAVLPNILTLKTGPSKGSHNGTETQIYLPDDHNSEKASLLQIIKTIKEALKTSNGEVQLFLPYVSSSAKRKLVGLVNYILYKLESSEVSGKIKIVYAEVPKSVNEKGEQAIEKFLRVQEKKKRLKMVVTKGLIKAGFTALGVTMSLDIAPLNMVIFATYAAIQSAVFFRLNTQIIKFTNGKQELKEKRMSQGVRGKLIHTSVALSRSSLIGLFANSLSTIASETIGITNMGFEHGLLNMIGATILGTMSTGLWGMTLAAETMDGIEEAKRENNEQKKRYWETRAMRIKLILSIVGGFGKVFSILGLPIGHIALGVISLGSIGVTIKYFHKLRKKQTVFNGPISLKNCRSVFQF